MTWRAAKSITKLREQIDTAYPNRSMLSDGILGDPSHSSRSSDHNPDQNGIVRAIDITHDPKNGVDCDDITESLVASKDARLKYLIWDRKIVSGSVGPSPWVWRPYTGSNPHDKHFHLSVVATNQADSTREWEIGMDWDKLEKLLRKVVREEVVKQRRLLAVGEDKTYSAAKVNLKKIGGTA